MVSLTKQDVQSVIDNSRSRLLERVATRQDVHALQDAVKLLSIALQQNQQLLRQDETQRSQLVRRSIALESRMVQLDHDLQTVRRAMMQLSQQQPTHHTTERVIMASAEAAQNTVQPAGLPNYGYNPTS